MAKIANLANAALADLAQIKPALAEQLSLRNYISPSGNEKLLADYYPFTPALNILKTVLRKMTSSQAENSHLIFGQPGIGKTYTGIILANLLGQDLSAPAPKNLLHRLREKDPELTELVEQIRSGGKRCLVIPVEKIQANDNLRLQLLSALDGALFLQEIDYVPKASKSLTEIFQETFNHLINYPELCGCTILIDGAEEYLKKDQPELKEFIDFCRRQAFPCQLVAFAGISRQRAQELDSTVFDTVHNFSLLSPDYDFEIFLGRRVLEMKNPEYRAVLNKEKDINSLLKMLETERLYGDREREWQLENILLANYPLHPLALYALPRLCEKLASPERNLKTFFLDNKVGSLTNLTQKLAFTQPNGRLSLYPLDSFYSYFEKNLNQHPYFSQYSIDELLPFISDLPFALRIVRLITLLHILNSNRLTATQQTVKDALHIAPQEENIVNDTLGTLVNKEILSFDFQTGAYRLAKTPATPSPEELIAGYKEKLKSTYSDARFFTSRLGGQSLSPAGFNRKFHTDKKTTVRFIDFSELEPQAIRREIDGLYQPQNLYRADLLVLYLIPESEQEAESFKEKLDSGDFNHPNLLLALPKQIPAFQEQIRECEALRRILAYEELFCEEENPLRESLLEQRERMRGELTPKIEEFFRADNFLWFREGVYHGDLKAQGEEEFLSAIFQEIFSRFPALEGDLLQHQETPQTQPYKKEILDLILNPGDLTLKADTDPKISRLVREFFLPAGLLKETKSDTFRWNLKPPKDSTLFSLWQFFKETLVGSGKDRKITEASELFRQLISPPFGLPRTFALAALAYFLKSYSTHIYLYRRKADLPENLPQEDFPPQELASRILEEALNQPQKFFFLFFEYRSEEKDLLDFIMSEFGSGLTMGPQAGIWERVQLALLNWYETLPLLTKKTLELPEQNAGRLLGLLSEIAQANSMETVLNHKLLPAMGFAPEDFSWQVDMPDFKDRLSECRQTIENYANLLREKLLDGICGLFRAKTPQDLPQALSEWESHLPPETYLNPPGEEIRNLLWAIKAKDDPEKLFFSGLPRQIGFAPLEQWEEDQSCEYLEKIAYLKLLAEDWMFEGAYSLPEEPEKRQQKIYALLDSCLKTAELSRKEYGELLENLLEEIAWNTAS